MRIGKEKMMAKSIAATDFGGLSAIGAALFSVGIPKNSVLKYETAIKGDKYLVIAHGTADEVAKAKEIIEGTEAETVEATIPPRREGRKVRRYLNSRQETIASHRLAYRTKGLIH
jgi:uncharacterized membrane protein